MSSRNLSLYLTFFLSLVLISAVSGKASLLKKTEHSDSSGYIIVNSILILGNNKTKEKIILRELNFSEGDTIDSKDLEETLSKSRNRIFNTNLFITVELLIVDRGPDRKDILIHVKERWYIYPIPIFELADRNFNEWWRERGRDPERINLGIFYTQRNMRGRNETLRAKVQLGFTKKFELFYIIPYINKNQKTGLSFDISYIINKQIPYKTAEHKLQYFDGDRYIRHKFRTGLLLSYRNKFYQIHNVGISYYNNSIADTVAKLNPQYLLDSQTTQRYFGIKYAFINDRRDITYYPLKGSYFKAEIEKSGLGVYNDLNQISLTAEYSIFKNLWKKMYLAAGIKQKLSFPGSQPYLNVRGLGYEKDYVSGYELYVVDGQHFSLLKLNLKWQLYSTKKEVSAVPVDEFGTIPFAVYFRIYSDGGYVSDNSFNPTNRSLSDEFLWGSGAGIDFVSYYDLVFRVEYSFNRLGDSGFFLHFKSAI